MGNPVGRPRKFKTVAEMEPLVERYFAECDERGEAYTVPGLASALGMWRQKLWEYEGRPEFRDTIKAAKGRIETQRARVLVERNGAVAGLIFDLKNNFGWKDAQEHEHKGADGGPIRLIWEAPGKA